MAAATIMRISAAPSLATLIEPVKLMAISAPKMISETRSTGSRTGGRLARTVCARCGPPGECVGCHDRPPADGWQADDPCPREP
ncbi:MAG: hypothetical protein RQ752_02175 [Thermohalobaculum sp.]|nr:hypothetical protein [Thermohalobaculum sp.]